MDVIMPQLGETVREGTVSIWYKKVGDPVKSDEALFEVETDKVTTEIPAPASGVLAEILVEPGIAVKVGTRIAVIRVAGEAAAGESKAAVEAPAASGPVVGAASGPSPSRPAIAVSRSGSRLSPVVRRLIAEHGLAADEIQGRGAEGRITRQDVLAHLEGRKATPALSTSGALTPRPEVPPATPPTALRPVAPGAVQPTAASPAGAVAAYGVEPGPDDTAVPMNKIRQRTAAHMVRTVAVSPHTLQAIEVDFSAVERARRAHGEAWKARQGFSLTYLPFIARAICAAISKFPNVNASVGDNVLIVHHRIHLGIAVDLNFEGLMAPVIRDAQNKTLRALALEINELATRARRGMLKPDDLSGGTYTLSNSGPFGTLITAPLIAQPQVAILSSDGVRKKPVVVEGPDGDSIAIRPIGVLAQNFDHRAFDGAYSAAFLRELKQIVEARDWATELP